MSDNIKQIENTNFNNNEESVRTAQTIEVSNTKQKRKTKAPLGIRPDDNTEKDFKNMATELSLSQTELFTKIFLDYSSKISKDKKYALLNCGNELNAIESAAKSLTENIESIVTKSINTIADKNTELSRLKDLSTSEIELKTKEYVVQIESLNNTINELNTQIKDLTMLKDSHDKQHNALIELLAQKEDELKNVQFLNDEKDKAIKNLNKEINTAIDNVHSLEKEISIIKRENKDIVLKNESLEASLSSVQSTLKSFNELKEAQLNNLKQTYEHNYKTQLELKEKNIKASYELKINELQLEIALLKKEKADK